MVAVVIHNRPDKKYVKPWWFARRLTKTFEIVPKTNKLRTNLGARALTVAQEC